MHPERIVLTNRSALAIGCVRFRDPSARRSARESTVGERVSSSNQRQRQGDESPHGQALMMTKH